MPDNPAIEQARIARDSAGQTASAYWVANQRAILRQAHRANGGKHLAEYQRLHAAYMAKVDAYMLACGLTRL